MCNNEGKGKLENHAIYDVNEYYSDCNPFSIKILVDGVGVWFTIDTGLEFRQFQNNFIWKIFQT